MPKGALSNQIAIQSMSGKSAMMPISEKIENILTGEQDQRKSFIIMSYVVWFILFFHLLCKTCRILFYNPPVFFPKPYLGI